MLQNYLNKKTQLLFYFEITCNEIKVTSKNDEIAIDEINSNKKNEIS